MEGTGGTWGQSGVCSAHPLSYMNCIKKLIAGPVSSQWGKAIYSSETEAHVEVGLVFPFPARRLGPCSFCLWVLKAEGSRGHAVMLIAPVTGKGGGEVFLGSETGNVVFSSRTCMRA